MSRVAGICLIILSIGTGILGIQEILHPDQLTRYAAYSTVLIGFLLFLAGIAHFKAPHKAFLMTIPFLIYFHIQMYSNAIFYFNNPRWIFQGLLMMASLLILYLSYHGYTSLLRRSTSL
jgi:hypothetical protein